MKQISVKTRALKEETKNFYERWVNEFCEAYSMSRDQVERLAIFREYKNEIDNESNANTN